jgi:hypothetical protein
MPTLSFFHEARLAFRKLLRAPFLASVSVLALTLGIGLTASMFSVAYSVLARGMPFADPDELMAITRTPVGARGQVRWTSFLDFRDWQEAQTTFSQMGAWTAGARDLVDDREGAARVFVTLLSPSMFPLLGEAAAMGRTFTPEEIGPDARVVVLSDRIWKNRYAADPQILGRALQLSGETFTVVGVMPPGFAFPDDQEIFLPLPYDAANTRRDRGFVRVLARLPTGTPPELAIAEMEGIADRLVRAYPDTNQPVRMHLVPLVRTFMGDDDVRLLWTATTTCGCCGRWWRRASSSSSSPAPTWRTSSRPGLWTGAGASPSQRPSAPAGGASSPSSSRSPWSWRWLAGPWGWPWRGRSSTGSTRPWEGGSPSG